MESQIADELVALHASIAQLPPHLKAVFDERYKALSGVILSFMATMIARDKELLALVEQQSLDARYIDFDLAATKRERDKLRAMLGEDNDERLQE